jgi:hypothetical protein
VNKKINFRIFILEANSENEEKFQGERQTAVTETDNGFEGWWRGSRGKCFCLASLRP